MFKSDHLAGVLNFRNGGSLPSIGGVTLASALARVEAAEQALEAARAQAKAAARREGRGVKNLFSESRFVARASAERWCDTARQEGEKAMVNILSRSVSMESMDENSPFQHLAKRLKKIQPEDWPEHVAKMRAVMNFAAPRWEQMRASGYFDAVERGDHEKAAAIYREANPELFQQSKGEAILAAGRRARMSGDTERPMPAAGALAAQIVTAGRKRRGEV